MDMHADYLAHREHGISADAVADLALLDALTGPVPLSQNKFKRRDQDLDPLLLASVAAASPTRHHYTHDFFPAVDMPKAEGSYDWTKWKGDVKHGKRLPYVSQQAPRSHRLQKENAALQPAENLPSPRERAQSSAVPAVSASAPTLPPKPELEVRCMARTRVPTPHGPVFLHLYHNNRDNKEHLALVVDPAQFEEGSSLAPPIRSRTLDAVWSENETDMDRIVRGAYTGRLGPNSRTVAPSQPAAPTSLHPALPAPLVRMHSECFTGETVGSMRCDCGEQLDEALRQMAQPITVPGVGTIPGRGVVVYMRQEGRGIGLLSKIRAYNLQDLGHDTVQANLMLGHGADERGYEVAVGIMRDLGLGGKEGQGEGMRLLTNNPDKVQALEAEGLRILERVPMVPRSWQKRVHAHAEPHIAGEDDVEEERIPGATMIGGEVTHGEDLDKYLRTKVLRMGHMLPLHHSDLDRS
ncbi:unnamed protein product [Peniophora sp. CBMAI 1063]|nr:unnamed protein product [Peniophora sp. CBMAI 1063]